MIKNFILMCLMFLLTINTVFATPIININPKNFDIQMYGGESIQKNLTITCSNFEAPIVANLYTEIKANQTNSEGFYVNFSENQFILNNNHPKIIKMRIYAIPNLKPDSFEIKIKVTTQIQEKTVFSGGGHRIIYINKTNQTIYKNKTIYVPYSQTLIKEVPVIENQTVNQTVFVENLTRIRAITNRLNELNQLNKAQHRFILILLGILLSIALGCIAIPFLFYIQRNTRNQSLS